MAKEIDPIIASALATAVEAISRLPEKWQSVTSDVDGMNAILDGINPDFQKMYRWEAKRLIDILLGLEPEGLDAIPGGREVIEHLKTIPGGAEMVERVTRKK